MLMYNMSILTFHELYPNDRALSPIVYAKAGGIFGIPKTCVQLFCLENILLLFIIDE